jgi:hypothetical protein
VSAGKRPQRFLEILRSRHGDTFNQNRYDEKLGSCHRAQDFQPHIVVLLIQATPTGRVARIQPFTSDEREESIAYTHTHVDRFYEILAGLQRIHVTKDLVAA